MKKSSVFDASSSALKKIMNNRKVQVSQETNAVLDDNTASQRASFEEQLKNAQDELKSISREIDEIQFSVDTKRKQIQQLDQVADQTKAELKTAQQNKTTAQQNLQSATIENINKISQKIANKQDDIVLDQKRIQELEKTKAEPQKQTSAQKAQMQRLNEQKQVLTKRQLEAQKSVKGANQVVSDEQKALETAKLEISKASGQSIKQAREKVQTKQIDLNTARYNLRGAQRELENVQENLEEVENKTSLLQGDNKGALEAVKAKLIKDQKLLDEFQTRLAVLQDANNQMQSVRAQLKKAEETVQQNERQKEQLRQALAEEINRLTVAKRRGLDCQKRVETLTNELTILQRSPASVPLEKEIQDERLPQVKETHKTKTRKSGQILKVAALTVSEILTRLDLGHNRKKRK